MESVEAPRVILPEGTKLYSHQVAGHEYDGKTKLGVLKHKNGNIIKPVKENDCRAARELRFYENVFCNRESDPLFTKLATFLPKFYGTCQIKMKDKTMQFLCLEDVCENFLTPSICDLKVGKKTYDPEADEAKVEYEKSKYLYSEVLGFRILGMKIYNNDTKTYMMKDKKFGKQITPEDMKSVLELLLTNDSYINCITMCGFLHKLIQLENWFKRQKKFSFYSSSLLIVYEGTLSLWYQWIKNNLHQFCELGSHPEENSAINSMCLKSILCKNLSNDLQCQICLFNKNLCQKVMSSCSLIRVSIIDCAHVFETSEIDNNYIFGLETLIQYIQSILNNEIKLIFQK